MIHESERGGVSTRITGRQFAAAASALLFADWASPAEEVAKIPPAGRTMTPRRAGDVLNVRDFEPACTGSITARAFRLPGNRH
jgi:hypothetical protein